MEKKLGKIEKARFGKGGYQHAMIGISFSLTGGSWGVADFWGEWAIERSDHCKWTESDRINGLGKASMRINQLLEDAKKESVSDLVGVPIEVTFKDMTLVSWRVLKEVL